MKSHPRINAYGTIDELNSLLGVVLIKLKDEKVRKFINQIQKDLFSVGGYLAGANVRIDVLSDRVGEMEKVIDWADTKLPPISNFILPEGIESAALLFFARSVARRAERELIALVQEDSIDEGILVYLNRLSDLLFILARYLNFKAGFEETIWKRK